MDETLEQVSINKAHDSDKMHEDDWLEHRRSMSDQSKTAGTIMRVCTFEVHSVLCTALLTQTQQRNIILLNGVVSSIRVGFPGSSATSPPSYAMSTTSPETYARALLQDPLMGSFISLM